MHLQLINRSGMALRSRHERAGRALATPLDHHRVVLHLSASTQTSCLRTGLPFLRMRGDVDIVPAGAADGFEAQSDFSSLEVWIAPSRLERMADELGLGGRHVDVGMVHMARDPRLQGLLHALAQDLQSDAPFGEHFRDGLVQSVATAVLLHASSPQQAFATTVLQRVQDYIEANLERPLSLPSLAQVASVSPWSLQRLFRGGVGMSVHRYVVSRRVERARQLVQQRAGALSEIALMAGFAHQSHMSRWMRRLPDAAPVQAAPASATNPNCMDASLA